MPVLTTCACSCQLPAPPVPATGLKRICERIALEELKRQKILAHLLRLCRPQPASGAAGVSHSYVPGGSAPFLAAAPSSAQRSLSSPLCLSSSQQLSKQVVPAAATSRGLVGVAVVDLFFAAAVPACGVEFQRIAGIEILQQGSCQKHIK